MRTAVAFAASALGMALLAPILLLAFPFLLVSMCTRALARLREPAYLTRDELIEFDPEIGWKPRANVNSHHLTVDLFQISTDSQGWRGRSSLDESDIVVFGDSFAAGYGIDDDGFFANLVSQPPIKPIGIGGYSMVQELLWMQRLAARLRHKLVVWLIYVGNDLYDNLSPELNGYRKPFVREIRGTDAWEICSAHVSFERWPVVQRVRKGHIHEAKLAELCSDTFFARRAYGACEFLIQEAQQLCASAGATLAVLTVPDKLLLSQEGHAYLKSLGVNRQNFDPELPDKSLESTCRKLGVTHVAGRQFLDRTCYKPNDCHWNALGHRRVARALVDLYASIERERGLTGAEWKPALSDLARSTLWPRWVRGQRVRRMLFRGAAS